MVRKKITLNEAPQLKRIIAEAVMNTIQGQTLQEDENPFANVGKPAPTPVEHFKNMYTRFLDRFNMAKEAVDQLIADNPGLASKYAASKKYKELTVILTKSKQESLKFMASAAKKDGVNEGLFDGQLNPYQKMNALLNSMVNGYLSLASYSNRLIKGGHMTYQQAAEPLGTAYVMVYKYLVGLKSTGVQGTQVQKPQKPKSITLSEEKLRNFISYSVARLLKEYKGLDIDPDYYDDPEENPDDEEKITKATMVHFPGHESDDEFYDKSDDIAAVPEEDEEESNEEEPIRLTESQIKRIVAKAIRKRLNEGFDSLGQSIYSARIDQEGDFAKKIFAVMGDIENQMSDIEEQMGDDFDDQNTGYYYEALDKAHTALDDLVHFCNSNY